jgi:stage V sporulation protein G
MKITAIDVHFSGEDAVKAYVDITLDDCFIIHGLRLIRHSTGYLLAMPQTKRRGKGRPYDAACPITRHARSMIEDAVMVEYLQVLANASSTVEKTG